MNQIQIKVGQMTCNHCRMNVKKGLKTLPNVSAVEVELATGKVTITGENVDILQVQDKITELGYIYQGKIL